MWFLGFFKRSCTMVYTLMQGNNFMKYFEGRQPGCAHTVVKISTKDGQDFNGSVAVCCIDIKNTNFVMSGLNLRKSTL